MARVIECVTGILMLLPNNGSGCWVGSVEQSSNWAAGWWRCRWKSKRHLSRNPSGAPLPFLRRSWVGRNGLGLKRYAFVGHAEEMYNWWGSRNPSDAPTEGMLV